MADIVSNGYLKDKNGQILEIVDKAARDGVAQNAGELETVKSELENLKETGGASGGSTITRMGTLVTLECDDGSEVTVESKTTETVTLVHCGKNLFPELVSAVTSYGVTISPNEDGSFSLNGTATSEAWPEIVKRTAPIYLAAGTYTLSAANADDITPVTIQAVDNTFSASVGQTYPQRNITLEEGTEVFAYVTIRTGVVYDAKTIYAQLEAGTEATSYESHVKSVNTGVLPITLAAYEGINTFYTETSDALTVKSSKSLSTIVAETVKKQLAVDWTAYNLPVLYLTGDTSTMTKDDAVDLAYQYGDLTGTASVKWQGTSSIQYPKKNYTVKFDQAFEAAEGWGEQKKYCTKANFIDFSHARNVVSAKLWGQIVACRTPANETLTACPNYGAVDGFPIIIILNDTFHGVYTFNVPKDGWMANMGSGANECILCADANSSANAFKASAVLGTDFDVEYITDEDNTDWATTSLNNLITACINSDGSDLDTTIAGMLDWESAIDWLIYTVLSRADDMVTKNYLLYTYDGTKWIFGAYDMDSTYGLYWNGESFISATSTTGIAASFASIISRHRVAQLICTYKKDALKARYAEIRAGVMSEDNVAMVFRNFVGPISRALLDEDNRKWPTIPNTNANNVQQILDWYRLRVAKIDAEIEAM